MYHTTTWATARGDKVVLANTVKNIDDVSGYFRKEIDYLMEKGYVLNEDGNQMVSP